MAQHSADRRGLFVFVRREHEGNNFFRWSIYRRKIPLGIKLSEGGYQSFHAAHAAGTKALTQLLADIMEEEKNSA